MEYEDIDGIGFILMKNEHFLNLKAAWEVAGGTVEDVGGDIQLFQTPEPAVAFRVRVEMAN